MLDEGFWAEIKASSAYSTCPAGFREILCILAGNLS
jgi:hypothetical protein